MKIQYKKENNEKLRQINFYQKESEKKQDTSTALFLNMKVESGLTRRKLILLIRSVMKRLKAHKQTEVAFDYSQVRNLVVQELSDTQKAKIFIENLCIGEYKFDRYLSKKRGRIKKIVIYGEMKPAEKKACMEGEKVARGVNLSRDLANTPGNDMTPTILAGEVKKLFKGEKNVKVEVLEDSQTKKLKMGLYNSVGNGSEEKSKFIIIKYSGAAASQKPIVLIGKGITFDNGGNNLKTDGGKDMNKDMTGGATVIGALQSIVALGIKRNVIALIPAAENLLSGAATKTGDIITSMSGKTVQINNTDAEGRLILADAITYAKRYKPEYVIDVATLTGAALVAVGQRASVVMSNDLDMENSIRQLGESVGDYFWPLPLWEEYLENMQSEYADLSNLGNVRYGGTITAGIFLNEFVKDLGGVKWAHLDIAPRMESIPADNLEEGATGEPVRMLVEFVRNN